jgi:hypothetical protein
MGNRSDRRSILVVSYCRTDLSKPTHYPSIQQNNRMVIEINMLLIAKLNLMSGMVIGAAAVVLMKQMCKTKRCKKHQETHTPVAMPD